MTSDSLAIIPNTIYEVIVTTYDKSGIANAAPMGITFDNENKVIIRPFLQTKTFENLWENNECVINFTFDPELFVKATLFKEELLSCNFTKSQFVNAPVLFTEEDNHIAVKIKEKTKEEEQERAVFIGEIVHSNLKHIDLKPINRAFSSLIEILIHATRVIHFSKRDKEDNPIFKELMALIEHHADIIRRVTSEQTYISILEKVMTKINSKKF
jgi:hypothetical protein